MYEAGAAAQPPHLPHTTNPPLPQGAGGREVRALYALWLRKNRTKNY